MYVMEAVCTHIYMFVHNGGCTCTYPTHACLYVMEAVCTHIYMQSVKKTLNGMTSLDRSIPV